MADDGGSSRSSRTSRTRIVPKITLCVVLLFLLMMCVIAIAWSVMNPQGPIIRISSLSVSNFSVSDAEPRRTYEVVFNMSNPNKKIDMFLHELSVSVGYDKVELARGTVLKTEDVSLERRREMKLRIAMVVKAEQGRKKKVFAEVVEEWRRRKEVKFDVSMEASVRFEAGNWPTESKLFNLNCGDVSVFLFGDDKGAGKLMGIGGKHDCCHV